MIKVILWDIDGTVLDFLLSERNSLIRNFGKFGLGECTDEMVKLYSSINIKYWEKLEKGEINKDEVMAGRFREFFEKMNITSVSAEIFTKSYEAALPDTVEFIEDAKDIIASFKGKYKQYAVTNGALAVQKAKLETSGLNSIFDGAFISDEIGYEKPSREYFNSVLSQIAPCSKDEILIIGDSLTSDMKGGNAAGIKCCWFNPNRKINSLGVRIDYEIHCLNEISNVLKTESY